MKHFLLTLLTFTTLSSFAALTVEDGKAWAKEHNLSLSEKFKSEYGIKDHAAPVIVTKNGGLAIIGDYMEVSTKGVKIVILNEKKDIVFSHFFGPYIDNLEAQAIIEDNTGHFYAVMETHNRKDDSDTRERMVKIDYDGKIEWDIALEQKENHYHRHCNTIILNEDGKHIDLVGTVQPTKTAIQNKEFYKWNGSVDGNGILKHVVGEKISQ